MSAGDWAVAAALAPWALVALGVLVDLFLRLWGPVAALLAATLDHLAGPD